jgi:superfamily I DNA and/or RNA helicase
MTLHEAWLAETLRVKGGFRGNLLAISSILQGKNPTTADDTRRAWQSIFLLIPVISSTFASIYRLFRYLEPGTLGWLLIDEAGQAPPQAAVGAIWRAKRVFSIGDPFQIEPICATPEEIVDGMAKSRIKDHTLSWAPSQVSVQNIIDRLSVFGSKRTIRDESYWISSPLRVHRRCLEPMFTISNLIAYESSMLLATQPDREFSLPPSCWWDVGGYTSDRQYVSDQGDALIDLLKEIFLKIKIPDLYVISPFREVISQIQQLLIRNKEFNEIFNQKFPTISFHTWVRQSVGTVHAFQGKQALVVFFVLGADKSTLGAIEWASRKPNLLNVAVTRAKARFYIIGDYELWKKWPYFEVAAKHLQRCKLGLLRN